MSVHYPSYFIRFHLSIITARSRYWLKIPKRTSKPPGKVFPSYGNGKVLVRYNRMLYFTYLKYKLQLRVMYTENIKYNSKTHKIPVKLLNHQIPPTPDRSALGSKLHNIRELHPVNHFPSQFMGIVLTFSPKNMLIMKTHLVCFAQKSTNTTSL